MIMLAKIADKVRRIAVTIDACILVMDKVIIERCKDTSSILIQRLIILFINVVIQNAFVCPLKYLLSAPTHMEWMPRQTVCNVSSV